MSEGKTTTVLFDAYETLFQNHHSLWMTIFDAIRREQGLRTSSGDLFRSWCTHTDRWKKTGNGPSDYSTRPPFKTYFEAWHECFQSAFHDLGEEGDAGAAVRAVMDALACCDLYPDAREALPLLMARFRTGVLSNADDAFLLPALERSGFCFRMVFTSEQGQMYKPDPELFTRGLDLMEADPSEVLYVGDTPSDDVLGAKLAGMRVAWLNRGKAWKDSLPAPDYEIMKLTDLIPILDN